MTARFIHHGDAVDFTPIADTPSGSVVVHEDLVGVTKRPLAAGELGTLHIEGVFELPKQTGAGKAIPFGKTVYWHAASGDVRADSAGGGKLLGKSVQETGDDDATIRVRLSQ